MHTFLHRPSVLFVGLVLFCQAQAQAPLQPQWVQIWPDGHLLPPTFGYPAADNHVAVDPVTNTVHCSLDDAAEQYSEHGELIYPFSTDGVPTGPPRVVDLHASSVPAPDNNVQNSLDMAVYGDVITVLHDWYNPVLGHSRELLDLHADGTEQLLSLSAGQPLFPIVNTVVAGPTGVLSTGSLSPSGAAAAMDEHGWPLLIPAHSGRYMAAAMKGDTLLLANTARMYRYLRPLGTAIDSFPIPFACASLHMAICGEDILVAGTPESGGVVRWARCSPTGTLRFQGAWTSPNGFVLREVAADGAQGCWIAGYTGSYENEDMQGHVVSISADGASVRHFTYGATINDLAASANHLFITGWYDITSTETYLIGVDTDLPTIVDEAYTRPVMRLYPDPAATEVMVRDLPAGTVQLQVIDALGRTLQRIDVQHRTSIRMDVKMLANGSYVLRASGTAGMHASRFIVKH